MGRLVMSIAGALLIAGTGGAVASPRAGPGSTAGPDATPTATVIVFPNGNGAIAVSPAGRDLDDDGVLRSRCDSADHRLGCRLGYAPGTLVTATAIPAAGRSFAGWAEADCGPGPCTVEAAEGVRELVATFNPLALEVLMAGSGTVTSTPAGISCTDNTGACTVAAPLGARFVLDAGTAPHEWRFGCDPEGGDRRARRCTAIVGEAPTVAGIAFGGAGGPERPRRIQVRLVVKREPGEQGTVRGRKIDCGTTCEARYGFGDLEELRAVETPGRRFAHWVNGCGTRLVCHFPVGPITSMEAVFGPPLAASLVRVRVTGRGARRTIVARVAVNRDSAVSLRLRRHGRRIATGNARVKAGQTPVRLRVPTRAAGGRYQLVALVKSGREQRRLVRAVRVRR